MKKTSITIINIASFLIIDSQIRIIDALTAFFIAGAVPGTTYTVSPFGMILVIFGVAIFALGLGSTFSRNTSPQVHPTLPKKRYGRV